MTDARYKLTYWPTAFRGCFVSHLFAYADVPFILEDDMDEIVRLKGLDLAEQSSPMMGPPVLEGLETGQTLTQTPAIMLYYSKEFDLQPQDPLLLARCMKIQMDCNDVLMEICRYNGTWMWKREEWVEFRATRFPRWMKLFEEELKRGHIGGDDVNFADIATHALFANMIRCLPELEEDVITHAPNIYALCKKIGAKPSLAAYVAREEECYGKSYCSGQIEQSIRENLALDQQ